MMHASVPPGSELPTSDLLIAASDLCRGDKVVTGNTRHFDKSPEADRPSGDSERRSLDREEREQLCRTFNGHMAVGTPGRRDPVLFEPGQDRCLD
jgi:hypothetical protein